MDNIKYLDHIKWSRGTDYFFKVSKDIADCIRNNSKYNPEDLSKYHLRDDDVLIYGIARIDYFDEFHTRFVETIERISNAGDEKYFVNHLVTNDSHRRFPREIHDLMRKEFGLASVDTDESKEGCEKIDSHLEWWVAHFFICLDHLLFEEPLNEVENNMASEQVTDITEILSVIKSIDKIFIVDDARTFDLEDMKRLNLDTDTKENETI